MNGRVVLVVAASVAASVGSLAWGEIIVDVGDDIWDDEGALMTFTADVEVIGGSGEVVYAWDFGDGLVGSGAEVTHAYGDNGFYTVTLTVSDDVGSGDDSLQAGIVNAPPNITNVTEDLTVTQGEVFDFSVSFTDPGFDDTHVVEWDLDGDSVFGDHFGANGQTSFLELGDHPISVRVWDDDGANAVAGFTATVIVPDPATVLLSALGGLALLRRRRR